jgi:hypothetical protein
MTHQPYFSVRFESTVRFQSRLDFLLQLREIQIEFEPVHRETQTLSFLLLFIADLHK